MPTHNQPHITQLLTEREAEILQLMCQGLSNPQIAKKLFITVNTVSWYTKQIYTKLDVNSRTQAVIRARQLGSSDTEASHNLPSYPSSFVGREADINEIRSMLEDEDVRLITIAGAGGMGKTRLSVEVARLALNQFADGIYFVSLSNVKSPNEIFAAIAQVIYGGMPGQGLIRYLAKKDMLLILDNFEHLLAGAKQLAELLYGTESLKLLVTSRTILNIYGEHTRHLEGINFPEYDTPNIDNYGAIQLFVDRARRCRRNFDFEEQRKAVIEICQAVDGMPLAIEMAAAWTKSLPCAVIEREIRSNINFLSHRDHNIDERHRSIRAIFDYSWDLLTEIEQRVLRRLSMFRGEFGFAAAQQVAGITHDILYELIDKSFLYQIGDGVYRFHDLLRQYVESRLVAIEQGKESTLSRLVRMYALLIRGDFSEVQEISNRILHRADKKESSFEVAFGTALRGVMEGVEGDYEQCKQLCEASRATLTPKDSLLAIFVHLGLAIAACGDEDYEMVKYHVCAGLNLGKDLHVLGFSALYLPLAAIVWAQDDENMERAIEYLGLAFSHKSSSSQWMKNWWFLAQLRDELKAEVGVAGYRQAWERGSLFNQQDVVHEILRDFGSNHAASV